MEEGGGGLSRCLLCLLFVKFSKYRSSDQAMWEYGTTDRARFVRARGCSYLRWGLCFRSCTVVEWSVVDARAASGATRIIVQIE